MWLQRGYQRGYQHEEPQKKKRLQRGYRSKQQYSRCFFLICFPTLLAVDCLFVCFCLCLCLLVCVCLCLFVYFFVWLFFVWLFVCFCLCLFVFVCFLFFLIVCWLVGGLVVWLFGCSCLFCLFFFVCVCVCWFVCLCLFVYFFCLVIFCLVVCLFLFVFVCLCLFFVFLIVCWLVGGLVVWLFGCSCLFCLFFFLFCFVLFCLFVWRHFFDHWLARRIDFVSWWCVIVISTTPPGSWSFRLDPDPNRLGGMQGDTDCMWSHHVGCLVLVLAYADEGDGLEQRRGRELRDLAPLAQNWRTWANSWQHWDCLRSATFSHKATVTEGEKRFFPSEYGAQQRQPCRHWHEVLEGKRQAEVFRVDQPQTREDERGCRGETTTWSEGNRVTLRQETGACRNNFWLPWVAQS